MLGPGGGLPQSRVRVCRRACRRQPPVGYRFDQSYGAGLHHGIEPATRRRPAGTEGRARPRQDRIMKLQFLSFCTLCLLSPVALPAQEQALVEELAPVLAAEDAREWRQDLFQRSLLATDSVVQRVAAMAAGRIGDLRATPLLIRTLDQPDSTVRVAAAFALGLLRDSAAVQPMIQRLTGLQPLDAPSAVEAVTALAKIGGRRVADFFASVLQGKVMLSQSDAAPANTQILLEAWRLGADAPADALLPFTRDTLQSVRWSAVYSLARLRAPGAAAQLLESLRDQDPATRALA